MPESFPKSSRLLRGGQFSRVYRRRRTVADGLLVVHGCENDEGIARLGLAVSRRVGNAVVRNRWKRILREAFRRSCDELPRGIDLVVTPRPGAGPRYDAVRESLLGLAARVSRKLAEGRA